MRSVVIELPFAPGTQNQWERTNRFQKKRIMLKIRDQIILKVGEGPWRKCYRDRRNPKFVHDRVVAEITKTWTKKRKVFIEVIVRRPKRYDYGNLVGGFKPFLDAIQWAGWCVTDHVKWVRDIYKDQVLGDEKTVIQIHVPETDAEEAALREKYDGQPEPQSLFNQEAGASAGA